MKLQSVHELENTRRKLRELLEEEYEAAMKRPIDNAHVRDATLNSLRRLINQLKEEIAHYMLRWVSTNGDKGPWSETATATIGT